MKKHFLRSVMNTILGCALIAAFGLMGGCKGSDGAAGPQGATGPAGSQGAIGPVGPQGANGTFGNSTCTDCHHMSNEGGSSIEPVRVTSMATGTTAAPNTAVLVSAKSFFTSGTGTVNILGYYWQFMDGIPATNSAAVSGPTLTVTLAAGTDYRTALVARELLPDRTMVVPVNGFAQEMAQNAEFMVTLFGDDGKIYYDIAKVKAANSDVANYAPVLTPGLSNVPVKLPVLLNAKGAGPYNWSLTKPGGSAAALDATAVKNPYFTPDVAGQYVASDGNGSSITIYAGDWRGAVTGVDMNTQTADGNGTLVPDAACTGCHDDTVAPDKFTPWKSSGHATKFEEGLNTGGHYGPGCFGCHTVGFVNPGLANGGFREQAGYSGFIADTFMFGPSADTARYSTMSNPTGSYFALFRETGIQCENCHGPQNKNATGRASADMSAAHMTSSNGSGPRTSLSSDVCGQCHGSPQHHGRFQEWQESPTGHGNFELAQNEGTNASCAACHSAQGNLIYQKQLLAGNPLRTIPAASITWTVDTVQPQTCVVCHDPHAEGTTTDVTTDAQPRITGNVPKLPAGFAATGVGKGAICMICHNTRNGSSGSDSYLHEDNDPVFGMMPSYAAPHAPAQSDVLMGHNAYFMGGSSAGTTTDPTAAYRSPHAGITDTCVNCHMVKSRPNAEFADYENTNHSFKANTEICTSCHGIDSGLAPKLQMDTQTMLNQVATAIQGAIISQATGTYAGNIASVELATSHGSPALNLAFSDGTTAPAALVNPAVVVPINTSAGQLLAKGLWNYNLINNDSSLGIHNPNFVRDVLGNTYSKMQELQ